MRDGLQNICRLVNSNGNAVTKYNYDAWGNVTISNPAGLRDVFGYRGGYQDPDSGLVRFGARWYSPKWGRWISQDPLLIQLLSTNENLLPNYSGLENLYNYVGNNPVNLYDLDGLNTVKPNGWPDPPGWKDGKDWKNTGNELEDPYGIRWRWHPEDKDHYDHWDHWERVRKGKYKEKERLDKEGNDLGDDAFKKRIANVAIAAGLAILVWGAGILLAPATGGTSLGAAAAITAAGVAISVSPDETI